jgi:glutaminyl-peptide cyclotransferase
MGGNRRQHVAGTGREARKSAKMLPLLLFLAGSLSLCTSCRKAELDETVSPVELDSFEPEATPETAAPEVHRLRTHIVAKYPHRRDAFTQGLLWHDGFLYESTGQYGQSSLRKVRLKDGKVLALEPLEPRIFGEGLALVGDSLIQLSWRSGRALRWDLESLEHEDTLSYSGEGWGACFDGDALVTSDGSAQLKFRDPQTLEVRRKVDVRKNGRAIYRLNELECVGSEVYANVWQKNEIVRIDAKTGRVTASIDASGLLSGSDAAGTDVLNGIAFVPETGHFLLTGKLWPYLFEVDFVPLEEAD